MYLWQTNTYLAAVSPLHHELVLKHDEVPFTLLVLHQRLELRAEGIEEVSCAGLDSLR